MIMPTPGVGVVTRRPSIELCCGHRHVKPTESDNRDDTDDNANTRGGRSDPEAVNRAVLWSPAFWVTLPGKDDSIFPSG
ncbi:hypothetical protein ACOMHN_015505 [Nucella lapillus]